MKSILARSIKKFFMAIAITGVMVVGVGTSSATSPFFENLLLTIPRIDVDGFGPLTVVLRLEDEATTTFGLFSATDRDTSITATASFDVGTGVLSIPTVKVGEEFFDVQLQHMPGDTFQVTVANAVTFAGQATYQQMCTTCHGADGTGVSAPALVNCSRCGDVEVLTNYIDIAMPRNAPGNCVGQCATDVAAYVRAAFNSGN